MSLAPGDLVFDRYIIDVELGRGGMGAVYRAMHKTLGHVVAIKAILGGAGGGTRGAAERARFGREAQLMAKVRHPNVVSILDFGSTEEGDLLMVLEYVEGDSLGDVLDRRLWLPWPRALALTVEVLAGLSAVHAAGIIHRDLKPGNVMLPRDRSGPAARLLDFGIAKPTDPAMRKLTKTGHMIGTPAYMAPEQLWGGEVDVRADVYAMGAMLYELLSGEVPWPSMDPRLLVKRSEEPPPPPPLPANAPPWPAELERVMLRALSPLPDDRPSSAASLAGELRQVGGAPRVTSPTQRVAGPRGPVVAQAPLTAPRTQERGFGQADGDAGTQVPNLRVHTREATDPTLAAKALQKPRPSERWSPAPAPEEPAGRVVVARLPAAWLRRRDRRQWLATQLPTGARSYTLGSELWFGVFPPAPPDALRESVAALLAGLGGELDEPPRAEEAPIEADFQLTAASLTGAAPLPRVVQKLVTRLLEG